MYICKLGNLIYHKFMNYFFFKKNFIYLLLFFITTVGFYIVKDFGIGIEEHFQRKSGFYWLNYILNFTNFDLLSVKVDEKISEINYFTPNLFPIEKVPYYGIIFDLPLAFIEIIFEIDQPQNYFFLRHIVIFTIFLLSAFFFYKIIINRFNNYFLANFGFLIYIFSPRIFGNIFFDNKDILFLSIITFNFYFFLKYLNNKSLTNLIYLSFICALSISSRIIGILIPISFIFFILMKSLSENEIKKNIEILLAFIFLLILFLFLHWPYLWTLSLHNWLNFFDPFFQAMNPTVFFAGEFYQSKYLPFSYLPSWIFLTTPVFLIVLFIYGFFLGIRRLFNRFIHISTLSKKKSHDLWNSQNESFDLIILINLILVILLYFSVDLALLSGWRHFYFLNFYLLYYVCFSVFILLIKFKKHIIKKNILLIILATFLLIQISDVYKYHPFQSSYFNNFVSKDIKNKYEIDTQSLSRVHAIKEILKEDYDNFKIGTASWTPLEDARSLLPKKIWGKLNFVGTDFDNADFIYTNHYYNVDINYNKKYQIPESFYLYKVFSVDDTKIYSIYKKIKK